MKWCVKAGLAIVVICLLWRFVAVKGGGSLKKFSIESIEVGRTTYNEVILIDPAAEVVVTSYGCMSFHELEDGKFVSIKFVYNNGDFVATDIGINQP